MSVTMANMTLKIYQLPHDHDNLFMPYSEGKVNVSDYNLVYSGETDTEDLEDIYCRFQFKVDGFNGHSLSVSDIVEIGGVKHYVDTIGYVRLS